MPVQPALLLHLESETILRLRLLVARAAQPDSLRWWDDRSLTAEGDFLTERLFARRPRLAGAKIALAAARSRHWAAILNEPGVVHLFDFGDEIEFELEAIPLTESWIPDEPPASPEALLLAIGRIIPDGTGYSCSHAGTAGTLTGPFEIQFSPDADPSLKPVIAEASALALAYGEGGAGRTVFPYLIR